MAQYPAWTHVGALRFNYRETHSPSISRSNVSNIFYQGSSRKLRITMATDSNAGHPLNGSQNSAQENKLKDQYAAFSQMLGVENQKDTTMKDVSEEKQVEKAQERKVESDRKNYELFNALLKKSGGTGRKPKKGNKRFMATGDPDSDTQPISTQPSPESSSEQGGNEEQNQPTPISMSEEEKRQGYDFMTEAFGSGVHKLSNTPIMGDTDSPTEETPQLLQKPNLPTARIAEPPDLLENVQDPSELLGDHMPEDGPKPILNPKPPLPRDETNNAQAEDSVVTHNKVISSEVEALLSSPSQPEKELLSNRDELGTANKGIRDELAKLDPTVLLESPIGSAIASQLQDSAKKAPTLLQKPRFVQSDTRSEIQQSESTITPPKRKSFKKGTFGVMKLENPYIICNNN